MVAVTADDLIDVMNLSDTTTVIEPIIDLAIDCLNIFGCDISNMAGVAGAKTLTLTSSQKGGVFVVARTIYKSFYKNEDGSSGSLGQLSASTSDLMANPTIWQQIKDIANEIKASSSGTIAFVVGTDESGLT